MHEVSIYLTSLSQIFQPYAKHWLPPLTQLIISGDSNSGGLNYFVIDIIATMLSWATVATLEVCICVNGISMYFPYVFCVCLCICSV